MHRTFFDMQPDHRPDDRKADEPRDERFVIVRRNVGLRVTEIFEGFGNAYAEDDAGEHFVINYKSQGVDVTRLKLDQHLSGNVSSTGFVVSAAT
jgi:hypothetical protein